MLSALISSERGQPAVPLARQLTHQRFVRPGPLVLGTALLKSPTPTEDRDRHVCYLRAAALRRSAARSFLFRLAPRVATGVGPYLHGHVPVFGVWPLRILDDQSSLRYLPPPFMVTARSRSRWNPSAERCSRFSIAATIAAKVSNSRRFSLRMGWARKNGMTLSIRSSRLRTT